jgi:hypothetical protein
MLPQHISLEEPRFVLDKIRNMCNVFLLTESRSRSPTDRWEDKKPWLFETLAYNLPRKPELGSDLSNLHHPQPIEKARFGKINASKR